MLGRQRFHYRTPKVRLSVALHHRRGDRRQPSRRTVVTTDRDEPLIIRADRIHPAPGQGGAPTVEAVLVRQGRVEALGSAAELRARAPDAAELDLAGRTLTPGLTDAHVHLVEWALRRRGADLTMARSPAEAAATVARHAGPTDGWVLGRGWNPHRWNAVPDLHQLDRLVPDRPVVLQSLDMHSLWANSKALAEAGIHAGTPDPQGGRIERDGSGEPTGVVRDNAMPLLERSVPAPSEAERRSALLEAQAALHAWGVTGVHTVEPDSLSLLEGVRHQGSLRLRILQHLPLARLDDAIRLGVRSGLGGDWIRIGGIKMFLDGALGSMTALLREPYEGTGDRGVATLSAGDFRDAVRRGARAGLAMTVHAIGDAAVDLALDVLGGEEARLDGPVPHRIEHVQLMGADRLGLDGGRADPALRGLVCSVQPSHLMTDWPAVDRHWGERGRGAYAFRTLEAAGAILALGSDAPVDPPDPRLGLHAAIQRRDLDGAPAGGWYPEERLDVGRALAGYTAGPARAAGDPRQGRLTAGGFADLVAWDRDPLARAGEGVRDLKAVLTMVDGEVVWTAR
jgi:predicted amidohydrolase YtcJ